MNPLANAHDCTLYSSSKQTIRNAAFSEADDGTITLILPERPDSSFPTDFRLVPEDSVKYGGESYLCTTSAVFSAYQVETTGKTYYICELFIKKAPNLREDLRINVDIEVSACFGASEVAEPINIANLSAGGLMFTSKNHYGKYIEFRFTLNAEKVELPLTAHILSVRPAAKEGFYNYGCQFTNLSLGAEQTLRRFIFAYEVHSRR